MLHLLSTEHHALLPPDTSRSHAAILSPSVGNSRIGRRKVLESETWFQPSTFSLLTTTQITATQTFYTTRQGTEFLAKHTAPDIHHIRDRSSVYHSSMGYSGTSSTTICTSAHGDIFASFFLSSAAGLSRTESSFGNLLWPSLAVFGPP